MGRYPRHASNSPFPCHRQKLNFPNAYDGTALVARPVPMKEIATNPKAKAADDVEGGDLQNMQTWAEKTVSEWSAVKEKARAEHRRVHVGRVFGILVEKGVRIEGGRSSPQIQGKRRVPGL